MRERELQNCFYTGSLNHKATSSLPGQPEPFFHYIQEFYKSHTKITLLNKETHKIFDLHNHTCVLQPTHKSKCLQDQPRSSINKIQLCIIEILCFPVMNDKFSRSKTHNHTSALENKASIVWFKWNQSVEFSLQLADFTGLKWNQSIEK